MVKANQLVINVPGFLSIAKNMKLDLTRYIGSAISKLSKVESS